MSLVRFKVNAFADPENSLRGGPGIVFLSPQRISQGAVRTFLEKQLDRAVQLLLEGGPYQLFLELKPT